MINGEARGGFQLRSGNASRPSQPGCAAVDGEGLERLDAPDQPVYSLCVLKRPDIYPRFGFRARQTNFIGHCDLHPAEACADPDIASPHIPRWLRSLRQSQCYSGQRFAVRAAIITAPLFASHVNREQFSGPIHLERLFLIALQGWLEIPTASIECPGDFSPSSDGCPASNRFFTTRPDDRIWFPSGAWCPGAEGQAAIGDGLTLFVRGAAAEVTGPVRFPVLAQT